MVQRRGSPHPRLRGPAVTPEYLVGRTRTLNALNTQRHGYASIEQR